MLVLTPETIEFLNSKRSHYDTLTKAGFVQNLDYPTKEGILRAAQQFAPAYTANLWCGECVCTMITFTYVQYDKWLAEQPKPKNIRKATFPKNDK
jgi:hypothetical protein